MQKFRKFRVFSQTLRYLSAIKETFCKITEKRSYKTALRGMVSTIIYASVI